MGEVACVWDGEMVVRGCGEGLVAGKVVVAGSGYPG